MNAREFDDKINILMEKYQGKKYEEAFQISKEITGENPKQRALLYNFQYCVQNLLGNSDKALDLLQQAYDEGLCYNPLQVGQDQDLKSIWKHPRFLELMSKFGKRFVEIKQKTSAQLILLTPTDHDPEKKNPLLITLHGNQQNAEEGREQWKFLSERGWIVAIPQSSQFTMTDSYVWDDINIGIPEIQHHFETIKSKYPLDLNKIVLAGFSKGGYLALELALSQKLPLKHLLLISPFIPDLSMYPPKLDNFKRMGGEIYILIGENDKECFKNANKLATLCIEKGIHSKIEIIKNLGHAYPDQFPKFLPRISIFFSI
jgi:predicted esterase